MDNIYYNPEKFDLEVFDEVETAGSYEFNTTVIWKDKEGKLYWLHDSGCSCPTPFDNYIKDDLNEINEETLYSFEEHLKNQYNITNDQYNECIKLVKKQLKQN